MAPPNKRQRSKIARQKEELRDSLWPDLKDNHLWHYERSDGWLNIPRAMPLVLHIMDNMSKGKPLSSVYLDLWCRTYNDSFIVANKHKEMAFFSGFTGERAERTWISRIKILEELGFISIKDGPSGQISYILIYNPYAIIREQKEKGQVETKSYNALMERMIEIRATDLQKTQEEKKDNDAITEVVTTEIELPVVRRRARPPRRATSE